MVKKGVITTINLTSGKVRVQSSDFGGDVTMEITVAGHIDITELSKGDSIAFVTFSDGTGCVLAVL